MKRTCRVKPEVLRARLRWRKELLTVLIGFEFGNSSAAERLEPVLEELGRSKERLPADDKPAVEVMEYLVGAFRDLCMWVQDSLVGDASSERHLRASRLKAVLVSERLPHERFPLFASAAQKVAEAISTVKEFGDVREVAERLSKVPVPVSYMAETGGGPARLFSESTETNGGTDGPFVVKVMFEIDGRPWATPQLLRANTIYDLDAKLTVPEWPEGLNELVIDYVSTLAPEHYRIGLPTIVRPDDVEELEFALKGNAEFPIPPFVSGAPCSPSIDPFVHFPPPTQARRRFGF